MDLVLINPSFKFQVNDLRPRLVEFSKRAIRFARDMEQNTVSRPLISQFVRSATSVGANYHEAQSGISRKDFRAKLYISLKEADETFYWLELLEPFTQEQKDIVYLKQECKEICKILQTIAKKLSD